MSRLAAPPLRLPRRVFWAGVVVLAFLGSVQFVLAPGRNFIDFTLFWAAGKTAGTPDLFVPELHAAWAQARGLIGAWWVYPPGSAWLFVPFALFPIAAGYWLHALVMLALVAAAGILGARIYALPRSIGLGLAFAWAPCLASAVIGQNAILGLVFALLAIEGLRRDEAWLAGLGVGLMLYKPTLALPLLGLLLLRRRWAALGVTGVVAVGWYLVGVAAAAGDWQWPATWVRVVSDYYPGDTAFNVVRAISVPGLLEGEGVPAVLALGAGAVLVLLALPRFLRAPIVEAAAGALLIGIAASPHALNYEGAMMLPILLWAAGGATGAGGLAEPARTRLLVAAYLLAPLYQLSEGIGWSPLVIVLLAASLIWIFGWWRSNGPATVGAQN